MFFTLTGVSLDFERDAQRVRATYDKLSDEIATRRGRFEMQAGREVSAGDDIARVVDQDSAAAQAAALAAGHEGGSGENLAGIGGVTGGGQDPAVSALTAAEIEAAEREEAGLCIASCLDVFLLCAFLTFLAACHLEIREGNRIAAALQLIREKAENLMYSDGMSSNKDTIELGQCVSTHRFAHSQRSFRIHMLIMPQSCARGMESVSRVSHSRMAIGDL